MRFSHHSHSVAEVRRRRHKRFQQGYVLVMFALLLVPLLLVAGLSVDVGLWYNRAGDLRKAADAAALSGVVWLPDTAAATTAARNTAAKNGFTHGVNNVTVDVSVSNQVERRIKVTITDSQVGSFFFQNLGGRKVPLARTAYAEYVVPVPMGSPRNFFGTGKLLRGGTVPGFTSEELYQSVNTYCSDRVDGDRHQPKSPVGSRCSATNQPERKPYELYIEAKPGRPSTIDVLLYDARLNVSAVPNNQVTGQTCVVTSNAGTWLTGGSSIMTITGPKIYQTRANQWSPWGSDQQLLTGQTFTRRGDRMRWVDGTETCTPTYGTEQQIDRWFGSGTNEVHTFTLYSADNTPLNDTDNPVKCQTQFSNTTPFDNIDYLGSVRWNNLCQITPSDPDGKYILRVENSGSTSPNNNGENNWGLVAKYTSASPVLCDGRNDAMCPRVYGKNAISVRAVADTTVASFYLAEIPAEHAGKRLRLELWDPGEGGQNIQIMRPSGTNGNTWTATPFSWVSPGVAGSPANNVTSVDVTASKFNGRLLEITVDLTGYAPPSNNNWWQIRYTFAGTVNDRTTWSARIEGDPIHLVEEF
jgi:Flp pilus assembly protein TadG